MKIIKSPSPNFSSSNYELIGSQIHKTFGLMPSTLKWLRNPKSYSSAHVLFTRGGDIHVLVPHNKRSWTAGRINKPSVRAKKIMLRYPWRSYVQPGHYLLQCEFECLASQTFTEEQYQAVVWYYETQLDFEITAENLLEHQDTAIDKPDLDPERLEILKRLSKKPLQSLVLVKGERAEIRVGDGEIIIRKT